MAASSPITSNGGNSTPKQNLRGLNKPKCIKCGNVARSRCPYKSCKSCCSKAQNPCPIHVLKPNATFPDKPTTSSSPLFDQASADASPSGASLKHTSLRHLSNSFAQFNGVSLRARRPLSRKDAQAINVWRFSKLKEYNDQNMEAENEAFDRYMQNVNLLEEAFLPNPSLEVLAPDELPLPESSATFNEDGVQKMIVGIKAKLKSDSERANKCRDRMQDLIDRGLKRLQKEEPVDEDGLIAMDDQSGEKDLKKLKGGGKWWAERTTATFDLLDKLNKARSEEDLESCLTIKQKLFNQKEMTTTLASGISDSHENRDAETLEEQNAHTDSIHRQKSDTAASSLPYSLPKLCQTIEIGQGILSDINVQFSSLDNIVDLSNLGI